MTAAHTKPVKYVALVGVLVLAGCSHSPTSPTPTIAIEAPPIAPTVTPTVSTPSPNDGLTRDPRFSLAFYRLFALDGYDTHGVLRPLHRRTEAPIIYLMTIDQQARAIDAQLLERAASIMIAGMTEWRLPFGIAGVERGTENIGRSNQITVTWNSDSNAPACGATSGDNQTITLYFRRQECLCAGNLRARTIKHELGHALGFTHTGDSQDLMSGLQDTRCDQAPSDREVFHAAVAYQRPIGSLDP